MQSSQLTDYGTSPNSKLQASMTEITISLIHKEKFRDFTGGKQFWNVIFRQ